MSGFAEEDSMNMRRKPTKERERAPSDEGGVALIWVLLAVVGLSFMGITANHIAQGSQFITENFEHEARAQYAAAGSLEEYFSTFAAVGLTSELEETYIDTAEVGDEALEDDSESDALEDYLGSDLTPRTYSYGDIVTSVRPLKLIESLEGDVYLLRVAASVVDARGLRPSAERELRTIGRIEPFVNLIGPMIAPNGLIADPGAEHLHLDGKKKGKGCGVVVDAAPLVVPAGMADLSGASKLHIKPAPKDATYDEMMAELDQSAGSYDELMDSLDIRVPWDVLVDPATWAGADVIIVPDDVAQFKFIDFDAMPKNRWPVVLVRGDLHVNSKLMKGRGMLIVDGALRIGNGAPDQPKLDWRGMIMTGKELDIWEGHLHSKGALITGLNCTPAELAAGTCVNRLRNPPDPKQNHLGVKFHACDALAALSQMMVFRPMTTSRHTRLY